MRISIASDLHLEHCDYEIRNHNNSDLLILAGDICVASQNDYYDFFYRCSFEFDEVIYVLGNHEHYNGDIAQTFYNLQDTTENLHNFNVLDNQFLDYKGIRFYGGTLWTDFNKNDPITKHYIQNTLSDYKCINFQNESITSEIIYNDYQKYLQTLKENCQNVDVVITHHSPCHLSIDPLYKDKHILNGGFVSDLSDFILDNKFKLWVHGHLHNPSDYNLGDCRIVCNPRGYPHQQSFKDFNLFTIDL